MQRIRFYTALFFTLASLLSLTVVRACSCMRPSPFKFRACSADVAFIGRVASRFDNCRNGPCHPYDDQEDGKITYVVNVIRMLTAGKIEDRVAFLETTTNPVKCGTSLKLNSLYYFFLGPPRSFSSNPVTTFWVGLCTSAYSAKTLNATEKIFSKNLSVNCK